MAFIDPASPSEVRFERAVDDANGRWKTLTYQPPVGQVSDFTPAVISLDKPTVQAGNGPRYTQGGTIFVPRGLDRRNGDRFTDLDGTRYRLIGGARGNQDHPIIGVDFGWVAFSFVTS